MLVCDLDLNGNHAIEGLYYGLAKPKWDAMFINGRTQLPVTFGQVMMNYDSLAYMSIENPRFGLYNFLKMNIFDNINKSDFIEVISSFNGMGIYKISSIGNCDYSGDEKCEHINFNRSIYDKGGKLYINKYWTGYFDIQGPEGPILRSIKKLLQL
jgi:hypothetical protein